MKLLGWMHRKFRQNSNEPLKNFAIGQTSFNEQQYYQRPSFGHKPYWQTQTGQLRKSFAGLETARVEEEEDYDESSEEISDIFHGFLAIGTLGSDPNLNDPLSTPEFAISVENITEKETEVTESELQLINDELEKVLGSEVKEDDSSGRNSHVSNGRSSYGSTITLSGKPFTDVTDGNGNGTTVCPLRGYLFGSAVEMSETTKTVGKKENRMSLGELFQKTKMAEENMGEKYERDDRRAEKEGDYKSAVHNMKKLLKKKLHHGSRNLAAVSGGTGDSGSAEKKLHKILHMFNKKVHPETTEKDEKLSKNVNTKNMRNYVGPDEDDEDLMTLPERFLSKERVRRYKSQSSLSDRLAVSNDPNWNKECWIKTDADYLVLEL